MSGRDTVIGYTPIGIGVGAGIVNGMVSVVAGDLFAEIVRERADGPRYVEAIQGARRMRSLALRPSLREWVVATSSERANGIPDWTQR